MNKVFCLNKNHFSINSSANDFLLDYSNTVELPIKDHPGSFAYVRKNHIHEGIDFYCEKGDAVYALEDGVIKDIKVFTGEKVGSPWWNETQAVFIQHNHFCINYGEIEVNKNIKIGDRVNAGDLLGHVKTVLKKDKGRPMNMLHIEMYEKHISTSIDSWDLNCFRPNGLLDPTDYFLKNFF